MTENQNWVAVPKIPVIVRAFEEDDRNFIGSAYMNDYWNHGIRGHHFRRNEETGVVFRMENYRRTEFTPIGSFLEKKTFNQGQFEILQSIMGRSKVWIAANPADHWHCYGFIIAEEGDTPEIMILHYLYVKGTYRRMGVGGALLMELLDPEKKLVYTHHTNYWFYILPKLAKAGFRPLYNPYLAR